MNTNLLDLTDEILFHIFKDDQKPFEHSLVNIRIRVIIDIWFKYANRKMTTLYSSSPDCIPDKITSEAVRFKQLFQKLQNDVRWLDIDVKNVFPLDPSFTLRNFG